MGLALGIIVGALVATIFFRAGMVIDRTLRDPAKVQERETWTEMFAARKAQQRQLETARDEVQAIVLDPRTRPDTRLRLQERVLPRLAERQR